ncbi:unnamed protein product [Pleuronectes platessa]|uniref:Uncharacterized protein n=1 Tax=Pleuronectes platessa TaxID=8262 RepID=A0A9N7YSZ0_PLEPL|nr:unnamed protein product [Pleuronectes platessa]
MELRRLREVILEDPRKDKEDEASLAKDEEKNGEAYAELPFVGHITQTNDTVTFGEFKTKLRSYESTEKYGKSDVNVEDDNGHMPRTCPDEYQVRREERKWDAPQRGRGGGLGRGLDHVKKADGETEAEPTSLSDLPHLHAEVSLARY